MIIEKTISQSVGQHTLRQRMSPEEYAKYMGVSRVTIYRMLRDGRIEGALKIGRQWRIDPNARVT